ncbi:unnamed protein product [Trifolium pratense]|uniref:Uncharacterized protein n=1 Tax=Trifolium pratense TaxID=57577 RepID=A0ACB0JUA5_TRIPR|nr:unnamed protein product [Trifolium pratense]
MAAETLPYQNGVAANSNSSSAAVKKPKDNDRRRRRRKPKKNNKTSEQPASNNNEDSDDAKENTDPKQVVEKVEIEYVPEKVDLYEGMDEEFRKIFEKFSFTDVAASEETDKKDDVAENAVIKKKAGSDSDSDDEENENDQKEKGGVSNKKKKLQRRMKIAELKQVSSRPDVVEVRMFYIVQLVSSCWVSVSFNAVMQMLLHNFLFIFQVWDATAADPKLLVFLKSYRNTVPVPRHWCQKRKFLQAYIEKEDSKKLKQKQRERMQPKMGKMDIDYQVLHDAFFKYQTKPKLTSLGELYHEGKEFEVKLREMKPGMLSHELKEALGMPEGAPPPWLINMQRYGPPPSYPHLKIPGLNAPIPPGASFGYHPGGWGKPPVDEYGRPLYGDVFGVQQQDQPNYEEEPVDKTKHWGDLEEEEEEEEDDDEDEEEEEIDEEEIEAGIQSVDSLSSTPTGVETPDVIDLRKQQRNKEPERPLYQVLEEKEEKIGAGSLLVPGHTYVVGTGTQDKSGAKRVDLLKGQKSDKVDVTLLPEELEAMENVLPAKYEEAREEEKMRSQREDFSDMVAENEKKRKRKQEKDGKSKKKDFKF